jgi:hypothetical protein
VADLLYLLTIVAFFALMVLFVRVCERVVGKDTAAAPDVEDPTTDTAVPEEVPA